MGRSRIAIFLASSLLVGLVGGLASAADSYVNFWVTWAGTTLSPVYDYMPPVGQEFTLSVWYATDLTEVEKVYTMFAFDTSVAYGTIATPQMQVVAMTSGGAFNIQAPPGHSGWNGPMINTLAGAAPTTGIAHNYGLATSFAIGAGEPLIGPTSGFRLYDVTFKAAGIAPPGLMKLWDCAGTSFLYDTFIVGKDAQGNPKTLSPGYSYPIFLGPEPGSVVALGAGLVGLAGLVGAARRRR